MKRRKSLNIGGRLREARRRAGMSLDALSKVSGVSKAMLSQIEQNKANPTVVVLYNVAAALNLDVADLLGRVSPKPHFNIIRADNERYHFISNEQCSIRTLSPLRMEKDIEFYEVVLHRGGSLDSDRHFRNTEEFVTVARGRVRICCAEHEAVLSRGDSAHYSADAPHKLENLGRGDAVLYLVVKYRAET